MPGRDRQEFRDPAFQIYVGDAGFAGENRDAYIQDCSPGCPAMQGTGTISAVFYYKEADDMSLVVTPQQVGLENLLQGMDALVGGMDAMFPIRRETDPSRCRARQQAAEEAARRRILRVRPYGGSGMSIDPAALRAQAAEEARARQQQAAEEAARVQAAIASYRATVAQIRISTVRLRGSLLAARGRAIAAGMAGTFRWSEQAMQAQTVLRGLQQAAEQAVTDLQAALGPQVILSEGRVVEIRPSGTTATYTQPRGGSRIDRGGKTARQRRRIMRHRPDRAKAGPTAPAPQNKPGVQPPPVHDPRVVELVERARPTPVPAPAPVTPKAERAPKLRAQGRNARRAGRNRVLRPVKKTPAQRAEQAARAQRHKALAARPVPSFACEVEAPASWSRDYDCPCGKTKLLHGAARDAHLHKCAA